MQKLKNEKHLPLKKSITQGKMFFKMQKCQEFCRLKIINGEKTAFEIPHLTDNKSSLNHKIFNFDPRIMGLLEQVKLNVISSNPLKKSIWRVLSGL